MVARTGKIGALLLLLAVLGVVLFFVRTATNAARANAAAPSHVLLDSDPTGALAVSELDGRMLGQTPMEVPVSAGANAAVLLFAKDREPQRVVLPEHGQVRTSLAAASDKAGAVCTLTLEAPEGAELEAIGAEIAEGGKLQIHGAAIVRAKPGQRVSGAWLVRCPTPGATATKHLQRRS